MQITLPAIGSGLCLDASSTCLWACLRSQRRLVRVKIDNGTVLQSISGIFSDPMQMARLGPQRLVVLDGYAEDARVLIIDAETGSLVHRFAVPVVESTDEGPAMVATIAGNTDGTLIAVSDHRGNYVSIFDTHGARLCTAGGPGTNPGQFFHIHHMRFVGSLLYISDIFNRRIQVFDITAGAVTRVANNLAQPVYAFTTDESGVYVMTVKGNSIITFLMETGVELNAVPLPFDMGTGGTVISLLLVEGHQFLMQQPGAQDTIIKVPI